MSQSENMVKIKDALLTVFGGYLGLNAEHVIESSVFEGDPYGWTSGNAVATISIEDGLPSTMDPPFFDMWLDVNQYMPGLHIEHVNGGISAVYED